MKATIDALISYSYVQDRFSILVQSQFDSRISFLVPLKYCPFCGTRIDPTWVNGFYKTSGPVKQATR
jgi:hypothetical protein